MSLCFVDVIGSLVWPTTEPTRSSVTLIWLRKPCRARRPAAAAPIGPLDAQRLLATDAVGARLDLLVALIEGRRGDLADQRLAALAQRIAQAREEAAPFFLGLGRAFRRSEQF